METLQIRALSLCSLCSLPFDAALNFFYTQRRGYSLLSPFLSLVIWLICVAYGDDADLGPDRTDNPLRIGADEPSLRFGTGSESGGGVSGTRQIEDTVIHGNIFNVRPATARPIFAFAYVNLRDPVRFLEFDDAEIALVQADQTFTIENLAAGDLTLVFLLDEGGVNQDGTIDDGDPIAIFQDPNATLASISANTEVSVEDIDVNFDLDDPRAGIARVESESSTIVSQRPREPQDSLVDHLGDPL